jgi:hypothetical protein
MAPSPNRQRLEVAFLIAPLAAILTLWFEAIIVAVLRAPGEAGSTLLLAPFALVFPGIGWAVVAYAAATVVGLPLYVWLKRRDALQRQSILLASAGAGMLVLAPFAVAMAGGTLELLLWTAAGAPSGAASGYALWWYALRSDAERRVA